jgi:hypothetical protein
MINIPANGKTVLELPMEVTLKEGLKAGVKMLTKPEEVDYSFSFRTKAGGPEGQQHLREQPHGDDWPGQNERSARRRQGRRPGQQSGKEEKKAEEKAAKKEERKEKRAEKKEARQEKKEARKEGN